MLNSRAMRAVVRNRLHIAACATAGAWAWGSLLGCTPSLLELIAISAVVLCVYEWNRVTDLREDAINCPDEAGATVASRGAISAFCVAMLAVVAIVIAVDRDVPRAAILLFALLLGFSYGTPPLRLKKRFILKNVSSSVGWTLLTVLVPAIGCVTRARAGALALAFGSMLGAVLVVELLWDLRDVAGDAAAGIRSVPLVAGPRATRLAIFAVNTIPALLVVTGVIMGTLRAAWLFVLVNTLFVTLFLVAFDDFSGARRLRTHLLVMTQTLLLLGLGAVAHRLA